ncbi:NAD-dependent malic enzyme [Cyanobium sp. BA20m-14]|uniref:NAD-dependent malic enzyme n=1 Tax=Cyanobium sp. BA20m-14 TaxID=2823703 RepID=UPI0020CEF9C1|nr:NAD-dependent malic enzyme [Cyanobium sp. BA20m-14]
MTSKRGLDLLRDPALNQGTAFAAPQRLAFGLEGLLPPQVESLDLQVQRSWAAFCQLEGPLERYAFVEGLRRSNLVLFHRFLSDHLEAVLPIVYTPTVGAVIQDFSRSYRTPIEGLFISADQRGRLRQVLRNGINGPIDLVLVTDSEGILGIGDQGVGGIHICQGKLAVYTLCAGLNPERVLAVALDVGTNRPSLLADPLYPGLHQRRLAGADYLGFVDEFVEAVQLECPGACLHWEDFGTSHARQLLERYREQLPSFNDDIQGTSGVVSAAVLAACQGLGQTLAEQRIVVFGAGTAGCGIAEGLLRLLQKGGLSHGQACERIWAVDREGLLVQGMAGLNPGAAALARDPQELDNFCRNLEGQIDLAAVVAQVHPTVLIGTSTVAGAFSRELVEEMARHCVHPVILPLSNPTSLAEAVPADLLAWTGGRALVATGSPFAPVELPGGRRVIGQCNNCFLFPGLGFATVALGLRAISDGMIDAGLQALAEWIPASRNPMAALMPALGDGAAVAAAVAQAVASAGVREGLAREGISQEQVPLLLQQARWLPTYLPLASSAV